MPFLQRFYHLVWATKGRQPLITPELEPVLYGFMRSKAIGLGGTVYAIGGIEDHVHLVVSVPPSIALSTFIGQVKGVASANTNKGRGPEAPRFAWQEEYGAFSFDAKRLPYVITYVEQQKEHHAQQRTIPLVERLAGETGGYLARESDVGYVADYDDWLDGMHRVGDQRTGLKARCYGATPRERGWGHATSPLEGALLNSPGASAPGGGRTSCPSFVKRWLQQAIASATNAPA